MISIRNAFIRILLQGIFFLSDIALSLQNLLIRKKSLVDFKVSDLDVEGYEGQLPRLEKIFQGMSEPKYWAKTSGTRKAPKKIPYDLKRTKLTQLSFMKAMIILTGHHSGKKTFFVFSTLDQDQSLTSGMIDHETEPCLFALLQAPYRYLMTKRGEKLRLLSGDLTARVILLLVSGPRFLYSTNPSTLTYFFKEYVSRNQEIKAKIKEFLNHSEELEAVLQLSEGNALERLHDFVQNESVDLKCLLPKLQGVITWDGGYVGIFLEQLKVMLPEVDLIPMFSMSTEAIETLPHRINSKIVFLPLAPYTQHEFMDLETHKILPAKDVKVGSSYTLIISDAWGLKRYDTQDIFYVKQMIDGLPDLVFKGRRGMTSSLTGEKLTEEQAVELSLGLKKVFPELAQSFFALYPRETDAGVGYELAIIGGEVKADLLSLSREAESILRNLNSEYESKVTSGRLLPLKATLSSASALASLMGNKEKWESQFKVLPLYEKVIR